MKNAEVTFGLHCAALPEDWSRWTALRAWKTDGIPPEEMIRKSALHLIAGDLIDPHLAQLAPGENFRLRMDFLRMLETALRRAAALQMEAVTIGCDWERIPQDATYRENWLAQMRFAAGILDGLPLNMGLRCRISNREDGLHFAEAAAILREIPTRKIRLAVEVHPHESAGLPEEQRLRSFCREALLLEYIYEPLIGNQLTQKWIAPGIQAAAEAGIPLFFQPRKAEGELLSAEAQTLQTWLSAAESGQKKTGIN